MQVAETDDSNNLMMSYLAEHVNSKLEFLVQVRHGAQTSEEDIREMIV